MKIAVLLLFSIFIANNIFSQEQDIATKESSKMHQPKYCLFYDNHTMPACPDVGENFDVETFIDRSAMQRLFFAGF